MGEQTRRSFLKQAGITFAGAAALVADSTAKGAVEEERRPSNEGRDERLRVGIIGPGGRGRGLMRAFASRDDVEVTHLCDVDEGSAATAARDLKSVTGKTAKLEPDLRRVLDDVSVDAVVIATPDHWHAPATILACDAGKHVYVEKPASHNLREGRLMIEAARRNNRVVQVGTQSRSADYLIQAVDRLRDGAIGDVLVAKAWNSQKRMNIGHQQPTDPPARLDYDTWIGPAPMVPYQQNMLPAHWRWFHAFGTGDIGNDGVHDIDIARWGLGVVTHPTRIAGNGGKYFFDDDQQFPDTYYVSFEYVAADGGRAKQLIYEQRTWSPYVQEGFENGNAFYGTKAVMLLCKKTGYQIIDSRGKVLDQAEGKLSEQAHVADFIRCIREGGRPHADIEIGHLSSSLSHLGNIAVRIGRTLQFDPVAEKIIGDDEANALLKREYRQGHWAVPKGVE